MGNSYHISGSRAGLLYPGFIEKPQDIGGNLDQVWSRASARLFFCLS